MPDFGSFACISQSFRSTTGGGGGASRALSFFAGLPAVLPALRAVTTFARAGLVCPTFLLPAATLGLSLVALLVVATARLLVVAVAALTPLPLPLPLFFPSAPLYPYPTVSSSPSPSAFPPSLSSPVPSLPLVFRAPWPSPTVVGHSRLAAGPRAASLGRDPHRLAPPKGCQCGPACGGISFALLRRCTARVLAPRHSGSLTRRRAAPRSGTK